MSDALEHEHNVVVSGTVENQGLFYDRFDHVVLLTAGVSPVIQ